MNGQKSWVFLGGIITQYGRQYEKGKAFNHACGLGKWGFTVIFKKE